jgi:hypothetical protein
MDALTTVAQLTSHELDLCGSQLTRCLSAPGTEAPIHADVRRELATVRTEQQARAAAGEAHHPSRPYDVGGQTTTELQRSRRELAANLAPVRPGSPSGVPILAHLNAIDAQPAAPPDQ